jgi:hypothetical protein
LNLLVIFSIRLERRFLPVLIFLLLAAQQSIGAKLEGTGQER